MVHCRVGIVQRPLIGSSEFVDDAAVAVAMGMMREWRLMMSAPVSGIWMVSSTLGVSEDAVILEEKSRARNQLRAATMAPAAPVQTA